MRSIFKSVIATCIILSTMMFNTTNAAGRRGVVTMSSVIPEFYTYIDSEPYYSTSAIVEEGNQIDEHIKNLSNWRDKKSYISEKHLEDEIQAKRDSLAQHTQSVASLISHFMSRYQYSRVVNNDAIVDSIQAIVNEKLRIREANVNRLEEAVEKGLEDSSFNLKGIDWKLIGLCAWLTIMAIALIAWFARASKKNPKRQKRREAPVSNVSPEEASSAIVVRRKTTSILREQNLDDVADNPDYYRIDTSDFCKESAVRRIYIKNTCIKDIYTMYAEDLRSPDNPMEDGCMVLGRWVYDKENNEYYVSLEHIVLPGDDAVFSEYELNFGGKIKLKVTEKLRKLRRETNLQYDLTCWVHSHPGLKVFFSNSDANVQMQLKHPTHPNFLTAIVVDILTPEQQFGIFTFKPDSTLNSQADLTKLYSLVELYQWAVESERNSFKPEDHFNTLANVTSHYEDCQSLQLSNSAIIDLDMLTVSQENGLTGIVHGYTYRGGLKTELVITKIAKEHDPQAKDVVGCLVTAAHCSIPTVRKAIADFIDKITVVLVYSTTDGVLTTIPVKDGDLCSDEKYYGEQKLEDLKIWTRRKR